jgi:molybdate transport system ATP-binding protein
MSGWFVHSSRYANFTFTIMKEHLAIYIGGDINKDIVIQRLRNNQLLNDIIELDPLKGELYSVLRLQELMDEEIRHEHIEIKTRSSLASLSEGEKKKALLQYIIDKAPEYIIIDSLFDSLDKVSQAAVQKKLEELSTHTLIIQVINRKKDILSFIENLYAVNNDQLVLHPDMAAFINETETYSLSGDVPDAIHSYELKEGDPLVKFDRVSVSYDERPIVKDINWTILPGEFWQLIGPNGSGKTTLLSMITGDNPKAYGQDIGLFGRKKGTGETVWDIKEKIGYFTTAMVHLFSGQDSIENMIISGFVDSVGLYTIPSDLQIQLAHQWLSLVGLYEKRKTPFRYFSLGHQRLILIIRAMVKHPPLLILDEPTSGVDDSHASMIIAFINKIAAESNTAILYVSHRTEQGLDPKRIFELVPGEDGSVGKLL